MPCRQLLIRPKNYSSPTDGATPTATPPYLVDIGLSPFSRSPSPFALFSTRLTAVNAKNNVPTGNNENREQTRINVKNNPCQEQLHLVILPHNQHLNINIRRGALLPMSISNFVAPSQDNLNNGLLMIASKSGSRFNHDESKKGWKTSSIPSSAPSAAGSAEFLPFPEPQPPYQSFSNPINITIKLDDPKEDPPEGIVPAIAINNTTTTILDLDLLPIKKRRLRQMQQQEQELLLANSTSSTNNTGQGIIGTNPATSSTLVPSQSQQCQEQSSTTTTTFLGLSSSSSSLQEQGSSASTSLRQYPLPLPYKPPKRRPVYVGDRRSQTFIDIESQRWWDRAHMAYPFHPKNRNKKPRRKTNISTNKKATHQLVDIYHEDDPRSRHYQEWLSSLYPGCRDIDEAAGDEPKNLLEKLGLVNPLAEAVMDANNQDQKLELPPWVTEQGLKEFDIMKLNEAEPKCQKFHYD